MKFFAVITTLLRIALLLGVSQGTSCPKAMSQTNEITASMKEIMASKGSITFSDRDDHDYEFIYCFVGTNVFAQRAVFPGYNHRVFRSLPLQGKMEMLGKELLGMSPDTAPPFPPHGPPYYRITCAKKGEITQIAFFTDSVATNLAQKLQKEFLTGGTSLSALPNVIMENQILRRQFGFFD